MMVSQVPTNLTLAKYRTLLILNTIRLIHSDALVLFYTKVIFTHNCLDHPPLRDLQLEY